MPKYPKNSTAANLKAAGTDIVSDSANVDEISAYSPTDATTNPSLILVAAEKKEYKAIVDRSIDYGKKNGKSLEEQITIAYDKLTVELGADILKVIPGRVSTELDPRLSFDKKKTVAKALTIINLYKEVGISKERVLIKIGSTWEGIQAAKELESEHGIHCNLTLLFSMPQAVACAEAKVTLISPFVGRISDWYKKHKKEEFSVDDDPGILSVKRIYNYYKKHGYKTEIMAASLRSVEQVKQLAGLDRMTVPLKLFDELLKTENEVPQILNVQSAQKEGDEKLTYINNQSKFRYAMNDDAMATENLAAGIRGFTEAANKISKMIEEKIKD